MKLRQKGLLQLSAVIVVGSLAACVQRGEQRGEQPGRIGDNTEVIREDVTRDTQKLGEEVSKKGETEIRGQRQVIQRRIEDISQDIPTVIVGQRKADINRMSVNDFMVLGLSEPVAKSVVQFREQHQDRFDSVEQLKQVPGMDQNWLKQYEGVLGTSGEMSEAKS